MALWIVLAISLISNTCLAAPSSVNGSTFWRESDYSILKTSTGENLQTAKKGGRILLYGPPTSCTDSTHDENGDSVLLCESFNGHNYCGDIGGWSNCDTTDWDIYGDRFEYGSQITTRSNRNISSLECDDKGQYVLDINHYDYDYPYDMTSMIYTLGTPKTTGTAYFTFYIAVDNTLAYQDSDTYSGLFGAGDPDAEFGTPFSFDLVYWNGGLRFRASGGDSGQWHSNIITLDHWYRVGFSVSYDTGIWAMYSNINGSWAYNVSGNYPEHDLKKIYFSSYMVGAATRYQIARLRVRTDGFGLACP